MYPSNIAIKIIHVISINICLSNNVYMYVKTITSATSHKPDQASWLILLA